MNEILHDGLDEHIHDALSNVAYKHQNRKVKFKYSKEQLDLEDEINGYKFLLPTNSYELCEIGNALHNCVASYVDYVEEKVCTIVIAYKDDETKKNAPKICIEVRNYSEGDFKGQVWQQRTDRNAEPNGEDSEVMKIWREKHNLFFDENRY